jgi:two-component system response regulator NreC
VNVVEHVSGEIKIMLVDDHQLFREGLVALLSAEPGMTVVGHAATSRQACAMTDQLKPDVVILDLTLPDGDGIAATREILRRRQRTRILILTMHATPFFVRKAIAAGAAGYALKSQAASEILEAVRTVAAGEAYVSPQMAPPPGSEPSRKPGQDGGLSALDELSPREREVFDLVMRGLSNQAIGENLCISIKTVETHRSHINKKLDVHSTGQLIRLAALQGLVSQ